MATALDQTIPGDSTGLLGDNAAEHASVFKDVSSLTSAITSDLVKGVGYMRGGSKPEEDPNILAPMIAKAHKELRTATRRGLMEPGEVTKSLSPEFQGIVGRWMNAGPMTQLSNQLSQVLSTELGKDITLTSPLSSGFVPYDLMAPARLIYPVYTPLRNKLPRTKGYGTSHRAKLITAVQGSGTGGLAPMAFDIAELPGGGSSIPGTSWPLNIPGSATHAAVDLNIAYKFFGMTEPISWLAQFSGQGFEDISALANLLLLQKFMLAEEYMLISGCSAVLATPAAPTVTVQTARTGEAPITGTTTNLYVYVTARNHFGETVPSAAGSHAITTSQTADVTIAQVPGALQYNIYVGTGTVAPGATSSHLMAANVGGGVFTLQGALPTTTAAPPTVDGGTGAATRYDGMASIFSSKATSYTGSAAGYFNNHVGATASVSALNPAFNAMWQATKADPAELIMEGSDVQRLSDDIRTNTATNYRMMIGQPDVTGMAIGAAVSEYVNPVTRKMVPILVHPWLPQGTAFIMSYTMPFPWTNVPNVQEVVNVQDYMSISWPVIDVTFRYSMFLYGTYINYAPIFNGLIQGLQVTGGTAGMALTSAAGTSS